MIEATQPLITDWVIAISAIAIAGLLAFYTYYTRKMQQSIADQVEEQNRQTEELIHQRLLNILPAILIKDEGELVSLRNVGNGTALNIFIRPIFSKTNSTIKDEDIKRFTYNLASLRPHEELSLPLKNGVWDGVGIIETVFGEVIFTDI